MAFPTTEKEWAARAAKHLKVELKRAEITYEELAKRLEKHGLKETQGSIANKLSRGTFSVVFFLATLAAIEAGGVRLEDI